MPIPATPITPRERDLDVLWRRFIKAIAQRDRVAELRLAAQLHAADYRTRP